MTLPIEARAIIHEMSEQLARLHYVQKRGCTPSAQAMKAFSIGPEETSWEPDLPELDALFVTWQLRISARDDRRVASTCTVNANPVKIAQPCELASLGEAV